MSQEPRDTDATPQQDFRVFFDSAPLAYQSLDEMGYILNVNPAWLKLLGYQQDEVVGEHISRFLTSSSADLLTDRFNNFKSLGTTSGNEFHFTTKTGEVIPVRIEGRIYRDDEGRFVQTHCILLDIRKEEAANRALVESERRYRRLVERALGGIWEIDENGDTTFVNPAMAGMLGYSEEEMQGRHLFDFMDDSGVEIAKQNLQRREMGITEQHDFEFLTKAGQRVVAFLDTKPILDEEGTYRGAVAEVIDVTQRRRHEKELFHSQKLESLGSLAGGIAHDFNNLLQAVFGNLDLVKQDLPAHSPLHEYLDEIQRASHRARDLCQQMLAYAGRATLVPEDIRLGELVREMSQILAVSLDKNAKLVLDVDEDLPAVHGDPTQLSQVIMNLITNASEALEGHPGPVTVKLMSETLDEPQLVRRYFGADLTPGQYLLISVTDEGVGMSAETQQRLFDPFFSTKFAGRGLGMAVVKGIVEIHNGGIRVSSSFGKGTTVEVALPVALMDLPAADSNAATTHEAGRKTLRLLVADDEDLVLKMVERMLERLGHKVTSVTNGQEAVDEVKARGGEFDVVLLDMTMPVLAGPQAYQVINCLRGDLPVIICSGFPPDDIAEEFPDPKPWGFLQKPFSQEKLIHLLDQVSR